MKPIAITKRKRAEEALRKSEEKYRLLIENSSDIIYTLNTEGVFILVSPACTALLGHPVTQVVGKPFQQFVHPDDLEKCLAFLHKTIELGQRQTGIEYRVQHADGTWRWFISNGFLVKDEAGKVVGYGGIARDITERKQTEEVLAQEENLLDALMDNIPDQVYFKDADSRFIRISKAQAERFCLSDPAQAVGKTDFDIFTENHARPAFEEEQKIMRTGQSLVGLEEKETWPDGRTAWVSTTKVPLRDKQGRIIGTFGISRDITERKRTEEALQESEKKYRTLVEKANEAITIVQDGVFVFANRKASELLGVPAGNLEGKPFIDVVWSEDREMVMENHKKRIAGETVRDAYDFRIIGAGGSLTWIYMSAATILWKGKPAILNLVTDITERKAAEESIQASLREKEVMLREIHHRVKNNMQVISSLFNLQAEKTVNPEYHEILKGGQTRIRAMSLVHEKLYQSRDLSKIDLAVYIQSLAVNLFQAYLVDPNQVRLETDFEEVPLDINSAVPFGLILNELISNSLKHAFPEGRKGKIRIGVKRGPDDTIILRVADDGIGFPKDLDFRQSESLGLQIANLLVGQLEGTIKLDRENGTTFTVTFREIKYAPRI
jgi:PAS domain S-box-containing protein